MDMLHHTIIALLCIFVAYQVGRWFGYRKGVGEVWTMLLYVFDAKEIDVNEEFEVIVTKHDGKSKKVN